MTRSRSGFVVAAVVLAAGGCSAEASQVRVAEPSSVEQPAANAQAGSASNAPSEQAGQQYADALREAFDAFEAEVRLAMDVEYQSQAEAEAVAMTLTTERFDALLSAALRARGLSVEGLAEYAKAHPDFFHEQQRRYWGRLEQLRAAIRSLAEPLPSERKLSMSTHGRRGPSR